MPSDIPGAASFPKFQTVTILWHNTSTEMSRQRLLLKALIKEQLVNKCTVTYINTRNLFRHCIWFQVTNPQQVEVAQDILETHPSGQSSQNVLQKLLHHRQTDAVKQLQTL